LVITVPWNEGRELALGTLNDILNSTIYKEGRPEMTLRRYAVVIESTSTGFSAYSPDVPGCAAAGDTLEETRCNFQEALELHFDAMRLVGEPIPDPTSCVNFVEVPAS
jgi:predicted RNase H-like HicB family nuclease